MQIIEPDRISLNSHSLNNYHVCFNPFQITTDHPVVDELMSVTATNMKTSPFISKDVFQNELFIFFSLLYFSPFIYFLTINITRERKKYKDLMKMMGLQDSAFW